MQTVKCRRIFAVLATAFILITGMYSEAGGIDSSFLCEEKQESTAVLTTQEDFFAGQEMCTSEMLGFYRLDRNEIRSCFTVEKLTPRSRLQVSLLWSVLAKFPENLLTADAVADAVQAGEPCSKKMIISYIHHQDGSKS